jgi:CRP/FNR family transcriptional activator FtrB
VPVDIGSHGTYAQPDIVGMLRLARFLAPLQPDDLDVLAAAAVVERRPSQAILFLQGDPAERFFVVLSGHVALFLGGMDDPANIARIAGPGETIGEACACGDATYPVSAQLFGPGDVIGIPAAALCSLLADRSDVVLAMLTDMSMTLRRQVRQIMDLKMKTAAQRLGSYLAGLSEVHSGAAMIRLPFEKKLLARHLGMQPETLSRALMKLQEIGVRYQKNGDTFHIGDLARLRGFCDEPADED